MFHTFTIHNSLRYLRLMSVLCTRNIRYYKFKLKRMISRKVAIIGLSVIVFLLYLIYNGSPFNEKEVIVKTKRLDDCLNSISKPESLLVDNNDALSYYVNDREHTPDFFPFIGNGYFGTSFSGNQRLYIRDKLHLQLPVPIDLLLDFSLTGFSSLEKIVLDLLHGELHKFGCYKQHSMCVSIHYRAFAHRTIPYLLIQEIKASNPTTNPVNVQLSKKPMPHLPAGAVQGTASLRAIDGAQVEYSLTTLLATLSDKRIVTVTVAEQVMSDYMQIRPGSTASMTLRTVIRYSDPVTVTPDEPAIRAFHARSRQELQTLLLGLSGGNADGMRKSHQDAWRSTWQRGFSIARSLAPGALNGDSVNCTLYYLMSHVAVIPTYQPAINWTGMALEPTGLHQYDRCYAGNDLLQVGQLWRRPQSMSELVSLVDQWMVTLVKFGCSHLVHAGTTGLTQAALLAIGEFRFSGRHLELNLHPSQLVRDMTFRNIAYGPFARVNVTVEVDDSNKALLFVSVLNNQKPFYACSAACNEATPMKLGSQRIQLPLRITKPRTALLYVSPDIDHIRQLKRAIHVQELSDAPAHEHHVIALHKHGHPYGGLPIIFWIGLVLLLLVFHLFLFKLIYSELCRGEPVIEPYNKYYT